MPNVNAIRKTSIDNLRRENKTKLFNNLMDDINYKIKRSMVESLKDSVKIFIERGNFLVGYMSYRELKLAGWDVEVEFCGVDQIPHIANPENVEEFFEAALETDKVHSIFMTIS